MSDQLSKQAQRAIKDAEGRVAIQKIPTGVSSFEGMKWCAKSRNLLPESLVGLTAKERRAVVLQQRKDKATRDGRRRKSSLTILARRERVAALWLAGVHPVEIAERVGCMPSTVWNDAYAMGLAVKDRGQA